jgi:hypothetical protein
MIPDDPRTSAVRRSKNAARVFAGGRLGESDQHEGGDGDQRSVSRGIAVDA